MTCPQHITFRRNTALREVICFGPEVKSHPSREDFHVMGTSHRERHVTRLQEESPRKKPQCSVMFVDVRRCGDPTQKYPSLAQLTCALPPGTTLYEMHLTDIFSDNTNSIQDSTNFLLKCVEPKHLRRTQIPSRHNFSPTSVKT